MFLHSRCTVSPLHTNRPSSCELQRHERACPRLITLLHVSGVHFHVSGVHCRVSGVHCRVSGILYKSLCFCVIYCPVPGGAGGNASSCQCRRRKGPRFDPWVGKIPWRRKWQPIPVFLPGESHGERNLDCYTPWGGKELDTTKRTHRHTYMWRVQ